MKGAKSYDVIVVRGGNAALCAALAAAVAAGGLAQAQSYPNRPVRIVTSAAGGGNDFAARLIAQGLTERFGQQVLVDNRGVTSIEVVAKAAPDGYTLLLYSGALWLMPFMRENLSWDPVRDFANVIWATQSPNILVVHPSLPAKSVKDLIALAKARPGELNYAAGSLGAPPHLAAELFKSMAGVNVVRINYKGTGASLNGLITGEVQLMFSTPGPVEPLINSSRLRALAVTSAQPSALLPGLPTVAASGLPGYEATSIQSIFAPARTPAAIIARLNKEIVQVLNKPEVKERFRRTGSEVVASSPEELTVMMKSEIARWGGVIKAAGIRE
ncbi:MAG: tripartite tricarboxylate transporter substrate binding protein [Betaproteobacteria bacterium]|nr:tripartite tricarboxylate transporter substrate binding protein [Betaproteobacteria bacterium]